MFGPSHRESSLSLAGRPSAALLDGHSRMADVISHGNAALLPHEVVAAELRWCSAPSGPITIWRAPLQAHPSRLKLLALVDENMAWVILVPRRSHGAVCR